MAMDKLPIWSPVTTGYRDVSSALAAMPALGVYALVIVILFNVFDFFVPLDMDGGSPVVGAILRFAFSSAESFFLVPIMIAVHRFIILDEVMPRYLLEPNQRIFRTFFGWLLALSALGLMFTAVFAQLGLPPVIAGVLVVGGVFVTNVVMVPLAIFFPALAVDAPGTTASNAWNDSKGHALNIFFILLLATLPLIAVVFVVVVALGPGAHTGASGLAGIVLIGVAQTFFIMVCVAIASRLFQALADRLLRSTPV
jgi:hypothetical protein